MLIIKDLHWLSGILEGEGCFSSSKNYPKMQKFNNENSQKINKAIMKCPHCGKYTATKYNEQSFFICENCGWTNKEEKCQKNQ